jgi:hypothetical protein
MSPVRLDQPTQLDGVTVEAPARAWAAAYPRRMRGSTEYRGPGPPPRLGRLAWPERRAGIVRRPAVLVRDHSAQELASKRSWIALFERRNIERPQLSMTSESKYRNQRARFETGALPWWPTIELPTMTHTTRRPCEWVGPTCYFWAA